MHKSQAKNPQYFEGILQVRDCTDEVIDFVREQALKHPFAFISKEKLVLGGGDFYFSDKRFLRSLGRKLEESFVGELKTSATLHTKSKETSKDLYRLTILFRQMSFKKGGELSYKGEVVRVIHVGNNVIVQDVKTGKKFHISLQEAERAAQYTKNLL
ncbi:hypothetical protein J4457_06545 [Candidatus Woesearchaeota archaeon]|nr:hypothetical protein [Candidatus Woesearchaeota archaeon]